MLFIVPIPVSNDSSTSYQLNLIYSTYLGGNGEDGVGPVFLDSDNNLTVIAKTYSTNFPIKNAIQTDNGGIDDIIIFKLNENGDELLFSTYFGDNGVDNVFGADVDSSGNIVFVGITESSNFPLKKPIFDNRSNGSRDIFITKISPDGQTIIFSTYFFSTSLYMVDVAVDTNDNIIVFGCTDGIRFISTDLNKQNVNGPTDFFLTKLSTDGQTILSSILLGGSGQETAQQMTLDSKNNPIFIGYTSSHDYPLNKAIKTDFGSSSLGIIINKFDYGSNSSIFSSCFGGIDLWAY